MNLAHSKFNFSNLGIENPKRIYHNLSFEDFYRHEISPHLQGIDKSIVTEFGAIAVDTGFCKGRSPKDKYFVQEPSSEKNVWWKTQGSDNNPLSDQTWQHLKSIVSKQLSSKELYVVDAFCGAHLKSRLSVRVITDVAWLAHFAKTIFIRPTAQELEHFSPGWVLLDTCKAGCSDFKTVDLRSEIFIAFHLKERMTLIGGTGYAGEIKKSLFTIMNYLLPLRGIGSFHCSANRGNRGGDTAIFFGLSGTGKTTLSADSKRALIGDDEHGWDEEGIFNLEGGCYAKCIDLSKDKEPDIYAAIKRDAILENVVVDSRGRVDFHSSQKTENTRVAYPLHHIHNIVTPISEGTHPARIIFLTCDAFGVLPPVARLNIEQAMYHYISGYTAKVAGTEQGVTEPTATFSSCFGAPFLLLHPIRYAEILAEKMKKYGSNCYLVNTGWSGGKSGVGRRMDLKVTRKIVDTILEGTLERSEWDQFPVFQFEIPRSISGVDSKILNPRNTWKNSNEFDSTLRQLGSMFRKNFEKFESFPGCQGLVKAGPQL